MKRVTVQINFTVLLRKEVLIQNNIKGFNCLTCSLVKLLLRSINTEQY